MFSGAVKALSEISMSSYLKAAATVAGMFVVIGGVMAGLAWDGPLAVAGRVVTWTTVIGMLLFFICALAAFYQDDKDEKESG